MELIFAIAGAALAACDGSPARSDPDLTWGPASNTLFQPPQDAVPFPCREVEEHIFVDCALASSRIITLNFCGDLPGSPPRTRENDLEFAVADCMKRPPAGDAECYLTSSCEDLNRAGACEPVTRSSRARESCIQSCYDAMFARSPDREGCKASCQRLRDFRSCIECTADCEGELDACIDRCPP